MPIDKTTGEIKKWENSNNKERLQNIHSNHKYEVAITCKQKKQFWQQKRSKAEIDKAIPYNGVTGKPYTKGVSLVIQCHAINNGFEKNPVYLTLNQAMAVSPNAEVKKAVDRNGKPIISELSNKEQRVRGIKVSYMAHPKIPKKNDKGEIITNPHTQKPIMIEDLTRPKMLETITLYHASQFENLDMNMLRGKDLSSLEQEREFFRNSFKEPSTQYIESLGLNPNTQREMKAYLMAQSKGRDFAPVIDYNKNTSQEVSQENTKEQTKVKQPKQKEVSRVM
ncbi:hypothetical protein CQA53_05625 [Helicobacter didelphidarum]|uniref:N-terminal domain-containing protein n=1 Tax=Helicobacter didelphidarum TaxID=2040648 RepID=A0A3D8IKX6_9HELI|nr:ArdC-like ssDNA-binding domain-containing protein [Helicobacter didelphidarum]RDU65773.1 hypothetical protein CQA53_05625 [Helicobacter didelphidarum]